MKMLGRNSIVLMAISVLVMASCNKQLEIPESNDPVFRTVGVLGNESFTIVAGDDGAYMYTMTEVENGVNVFSGMISNGEFSLEMGIYDGLIDIPAHQPVSYLGNLSPVFSQDSVGPIITLSKSTLTSMTGSQYIQSIDWEIDGDSAGLNEAYITEPGIYEVTANVTFMDQSTTSLTNDVIAGYQIHGNYMIDFSVGTQGAVTATIDNMGNAVDQIKWFKDGILISDTEYLNTNFPQGMHTLTAEVTFSNGAVRSKSVKVSGSSWQNSVNDFTIFENLSSYALPFRDFNVRLLIEHNGQQYLSEIADNSESALVITGVEYFGKNDAGKDVYKISADVSANVKAAGSTTDVPVEFSTVFGVEIP